MELLEQLLFNVKNCFFILFFFLGISCLSTKVRTTDAVDGIKYFLGNKEYFENKAKVIIKKNLRDNNNSLYIDDLRFIVIPLFNFPNGISYDNSLNTIINSLKIDSETVFNEILMFEVQHFYVGNYFCESNFCKVNLRSDSPESFFKEERIINETLGKHFYNLIFTIADVPGYWFLLKDEKVEVFSLDTETIVSEEEIFQYLPKNRD